MQRDLTDLPTLTYLRYAQGSKEIYYMAKETYYMAKETYYMAKETYYMAKETYS